MTEDGRRMKKRHCGLAKHVGAPVLVWLDRKPLDESKLDGFVVGLSDDLVLLHVVDGDNLLLNGYAAVRIRDVRTWGAVSDFLVRAMPILEQSPQVPDGLDLSTVGALISSAEMQFPLIMIEYERKRPGFVYIGRVAKMTNKAVFLAKVDPNARWKKPERFAFKDITQVEFGDGYSLALAHVMENEGNLGTTGFKE